MNKERLLRELQELLDELYVPVTTTKINDNKRESKK